MRHIEAKLVVNGELEHSFVINNKLSFIVFCDEIHTSNQIPNDKLDTSWSSTNPKRIGFANYLRKLVWEYV